MPLFVVPTPIGNLEDMTYRAVRVLREADVLAAEDTRSAQRLLGHFAIERPRLVSFFEGNEAKRTEELVAALAAGQNVALISEAGMPGVSDPGHRLVAAAIAAGARVEVLPGASAVTTAVVGSGLATDRFLFLGFLPREGGKRRAALAQLAAEPATLVCYESPNRVGDCLADMAAVLGEARAACLARELTKLHEEYVRGSLAELAARYAGEPPRGECTLVVAGADPAAAGAEPVDLEDQVRALLAEGASAKDVAARLSISTGLPRRKLYQLAIALSSRAR